MTRQTLQLYLIIIITITLINGIGLGIMLSIFFKLKKIDLAYVFFIISGVATIITTLSKLGKSFSSFIDKM